MVAVMIGVDPDKASYTAVVISSAEQPLGRVRACAAQTRRLLAWAAAWPERAWAIEGADGTGHLLDWQLLAAGERVLDVQPKLSARVRLLAAGAASSNDPNDASSGKRKACRLSRPGNRRPGRAIHMAAVTQIRYRHSPGRARYDKKKAEGRTGKRPCARCSGRSATPSSPASKPAPAAPRPARTAREGNRGTTLHPGRLALTPHAGSSGKPLPSLSPALRPLLIRLPGSR